MRERRVESGEVDLAVREWGDGNQPTVILIHGYPDTSAVWTDVAERLAARFHVAAYDVRGAGGSPPPAEPSGYAMPGLVEDLAAVIEQVSPGRPVHVVGHDWGALQGWAAVTDPLTRDRIASFTSAGGVSLAHLTACRRRIAERGPRGVATVAGQLAKSWYMGFFQVPILPEMTVRAVGRRGWETVLRREGVPRRAWHPADTLVQDALNGLNLYRANMMEPRQDEPPRVSTPVQIVVSMRDNYLAPELARAHAEWVDHVWQRQAAVGHWIQLTRPDLLSRWITEFIDAIEAEAPLNSYEGKAFDGQLVVVTGAGSGIGRATAYGFAANGARVVAADIDGAAAERTAKGIGGTAYDYQVDVADAAAMERFATWVRDTHGVPDVVVNNAGIAVAGSLLDTSEEDWDRITAVNLDGVYRGCRLFGRQMVERRQGGHLVNVSSMAAFAPAAGLPTYSAVKAGVLQLSECLRIELADRGIGVSAICPGVISTSIPANTRYVGYAPEQADRMRRWSIRAIERGKPPERVALAIMQAVLRNRPVVPVTVEAYVSRALSRISPAATRRLSAAAERLANTSRTRGMMGQ